MATGSSGPMPADGAVECLFSLASLVHTLRVQWGQIPQAADLGFDRQTIRRAENRAIGDQQRSDGLLILGDNDHPGIASSLRSSQ
jgi:hypothetical protein